MPERGWLLERLKRADFGWMDDILGLFLGASSTGLGVLDSSPLHWRCVDFEFRLVAFVLKAVCFARVGNGIPGVTLAFM